MHMNEMVGELVAYIPHQPMRDERIQDAPNASETEENSELNPAKQRQHDIIAAIQPYRNHPEVLKKLDEFRIGKTTLPSAGITAGTYTNWIRSQFAPLPGIEAEQHLAELIEKGLAVRQNMRPGAEPTPEEESAFIDMTYAFQHMFLANAGLVHNRAKYYSHLMPFEDLTQAGNRKLIEAVCAYDATRGNKFSSFATIKIQEGIWRCLEKELRLMRIPAPIHHLWLKADRMRYKFERDHSTKPTIEQLATLCETTPEAVDEALKLNDAVLLSLDIEAEPEAKETALRASGIIIDAGDPIDDATEEAAIQQDLDRAIRLAGLRPDQKWLLGLRFGLPPATFDRYLPTKAERQAYRRSFALLQATHPDWRPVDGASLEQIGGLLGITREGARQREVRIMQKLKSAAGAIAIKYQ